MEQNREPRNRSLTKEQRQHNGARIVFSANGAGTTGHPYAHTHTKSLTRHRLYTLHESELKMDHRPKCKT